MKAQPNNFPHFKAQPDAAPLFPSVLALPFLFFFLQLFLIPFVA